MAKYSVHFNLKSKCFKDVNVTSENLRLRINKGDSNITVENVEASTEEQAREIAIKAANMLLDNLAVCYDEVLEIDHQSGWRFEKETENGNKHISVSISETIIPRDEIKVKKYNESGNLMGVFDSSVIRDVMDRSSHQPSASYFRKAKLSKHPFEKFRNLYLVVENIGHQINPHLTDSKLLEETLPIVFEDKEQSLENVAKVTPGFTFSGNLFKDVSTLLYRRNRCALDHAKRRMKVPYNPQDEQAVEGSLSLMEFVARSYLAYKKRPS
jgi:hypothetical protein